MADSKLKIGVTSAIALACAGATFAFLRYKYRLRDAVEALNYLTVRTVTTEKACDEVVHELRNRIKHYRAVGFDCEWVTEEGRRQPVALVQLSTFDGLCGLFRLSHMKTVPKSLKDLLEDETIYKVGVAPCDDGKYLRKDYSVDLKSTLDIRHLAELCGHDAGGLASLSKALLRVVLDKSWRIRCSDWGADTLSDRQTSYAAADAHVAIKMFVDLVQEYHSSGLAWLKRSSDVWLNLDELCWKYVDINYRTKQNPKKSEIAREGKEKNTEVMSKRYPHATRSKPLYHNCFLEAPDGEMLCTCDNKKAMWYVEKELADVVGSEPLTVRLRFEPSGRSVGDVGRYYQLTKENKCVVCGSADSYIRKNVVPREYRKYFPEIMKEHSSHDVVLLCVPCHKASNIRDKPVRERLAQLCSAPLSTIDNSKYNEDSQCKKVRSAARALIYQTSNLPEKRRKELEDTILEHFPDHIEVTQELLQEASHVQVVKVRSAARALIYQSSNLPEQRRKALEDVILQHFPEHDEITQELLQEATNIQVVFENVDYESHGQKVVEHFLEQGGGLLKLEEIWREHFLTSMKPKHMPDLWSIKHNEERLRVRFNEGRLSDQDLKLIGLSRWL